jgi:hypothetical protein
MRNRPKLTGYIVNSEGEYVETYKIPPVQEEISLNKVRSALPGNISLKPGKDGVYMNGKKLRSGELIGPNLYWVEKEPDDTELTKYQPVDKSSGDFFNL